MPGPRSAGLNGLNWQVQVDPLTLSITNLLALVPVAESFCAFPPETPASMATTANGMSQVTRFIDISFPFRRSHARHGSACVLDAHSFPDRPTARRRKRNRT